MFDLRQGGAGGGALYEEGESDDELVAADEDGQVVALCLSPLSDILLSIFF